jgi:hypothetical protein
MDRNDCFPEFFAVERDGWYKLYYNQIEQNFKTLKFPANILWPVDDLELGYLSSITASRPRDGRVTFVRKWNGRTHRSCVWYYTKDQVELNYKGEVRQIPVLKVTNCEENTLPFNSTELKTKGRKTKPIPMAPRFPVSSAIPISTN